MHRLIIVAALTQSLVCGFVLNGGSPFASPKWMVKNGNLDIACKKLGISSQGRSWMRMSTTDESEPVNVAETEPVVSEAPPATSSTTSDFSQYAVGQQYQGTVISAKTFGVFVDTGKKPNILIPRSLLSNLQFKKLTTLAEEKSKEEIKIELVGVSAQNQTLSAKFIPSMNGLVDLSSLDQKELSTRRFNATVISTHDFGLFASVEELGVQGLLPASLLPEVLSAGTIKASYPVGSTIVIKIEKYDLEKNKITLSSRFRDEAVDPENLKIDKEKWVQGVVQSATNFGLFVRPAGSETVGLVHTSKIPRDLLSILKLKNTAEISANKSDYENLFSSGDVVKVRYNSISNGKLSLAMVPFQADEDDDDDYIVEGRDSEEQLDSDEEDEDEDDEDDGFDPESVLLWWRGAPYVKGGDTLDEPKDEELEVPLESNKIVEGTWRRLFEIDMRADLDDFSSKLQEAEAKELAEEIGELDGLDEFMVDSLGFGLPNASNKRVGSFVGASLLPPEWKAEMEFFKQKEDLESKITAGLRGGKTADAVELDAFLKEADAESSKGRRPEEIFEPVVVAEAPVEVVSGSADSINAE